MTDRPTGGLGRRRRQYGMVTIDQGKQHGPFGMKWFYQRQIAAEPKALILAPGSADG
jgi:hypothetical protein